MILTLTILTTWALSAMVARNVTVNAFNGSHQLQVAGDPPTVAHLEDQLRTVQPNLPRQLQWSRLNQDGVTYDRASRGSRVHDGETYTAVAAPAGEDDDLKRWLNAPSPKPRTRDR